ncbi:unnamed protein product [Prorocentrum cordatum]|uniref:Uncharacterized protein n=1 Tax=Prorocentrum cordatum TaxID=2364126 RepID=A0ABN9VF97_9DINO|nr:unnamed protein product [Polarella glacialis]
MVAPRGQQHVGGTQEWPRPERGARRGGPAPLERGRPRTLEVRASAAATKRRARAGEKPLRGRRGGEALLLGLWHGGRASRRHGPVRASSASVGSGMTSIQSDSGSKI